MNPRRPMLLAVLFAAVSLPAFAGARSYPITQKQIAAAVTDGGLQVSANEVSLLANVVATVRQPVLRLSSVQPAANHLLIARMECANAEQCIPFMVALRVNGIAPQTAVKDIEPRPRPYRPANRPVTLLVRAGSRAILLLNGPHVHIRIPVICLENGTMGQTVRAANPDRSQYYTVRVAGDQLLKGRL